MSETKATTDQLEHSVFTCDMCTGREKLHVYYTLNQLQEHVSATHPSPEPFIAKQGGSNGTVSTQ